MFDNNKIINVLIPDGEVKFALNVVRDLSSYKFIKVHILSKYNWVEIRFSRHIDSFTYYPGIDTEKKWIEIIRKEVIKKNIDVLFPVHLTNIRLLSKHKGEFVKILSNLQLPTVRSFDIANNKWNLYKFLKKNEINTPITFHSKFFNEIEFDHKLKFPVLVKPLGKMGGIGIMKADNLKSLFSTLSDNEDLIIQQYINGTDIDMSILCEKGSILAYTIQQGYIFSRVPRSPALGVEFLYKDKIFKSIKKIVEKLNWSGLAHIDLRFDNNDLKFKVIEINPRVWGSIEMSNKVGVNFSYLYCLKSMGVEFEYPEYKFEKCVNNTGLIKVLKKNLFDKNNRYQIPEKFLLKNDLLDPIPSMYIFFVKRIKKIFPKTLNPQRLIKKLS